MSTRQSLILGVSLMVCSLILALGFGSPSVAQSKLGADGPRSQIGRYQMTNGPKPCYLWDTTTGQAWEMDGIGPPQGWKELVGPVGAR